MRRRGFISLLGGAAAWPSILKSQQPERMRRIAMLLTFQQSDWEGQSRVLAFRDDLRRLGWNEGRDVQFEYRWSRLDTESLRRIAKEIVALQPDLIIAQNTPATAAVLQQTRTIPVVFFQSSDPVGSGLVASEARPGGNVTGLIDLEDSLGGKWLELLKEIAPRVVSVAFVFNPLAAIYANNYLAPFKSTAASYGIEAIAAPVHDKSELESVVAAHARKTNTGLIVMPEAFMGLHRAAITSLAARHRLPTVYPYRYFTQIGGLLSYGIDLLDQYRRAAGFADRILRGAKPSALPVQRPVKFELTINLKTAKTLGLAIPESIMLRADEVIE